MTTPSSPQGDDGSRWLSDEEQRVWQSYLHGTLLLEDHLDRQLQRDAGLPHIYYALLVHLSHAPDMSLRMTELAKGIKITRSRLSHAISRLEASGWVRREDCSSDRRGQLACLTQSGLAKLRESAPGHVAAVRQGLFDRLSPEQVVQLGEIMRAMTAGLEPESRGADLPWRR
ncbi:MarR family winged helix-turn-helix transcriptional regulator [Streptomyces fuscigenes]|uniref:MarR family winged helix-turn-helix transcriptional regulator n=1 Tax=Streptomyces fuscigenes TaxID=1528880 RepID=UPI001F41FD1F|nr:MarR family transcriptional regulator [Streptomyces fuscigenes]MCF3962668.1 MarR family transcriptional regulator [Streptomyces fuscigenes]